MNKVYKSNGSVLFVLYLFASTLLPISSLGAPYDQPLVIVSGLGQDPPKVFAGDTFIETFNLTNVGDEEATMVQLWLNMSYPFAITGLSSNIFVGDLENGETRSVSVELSVHEEASVRIYYIAFVIKYKDYGGEDYIEVGTFNVQILGKPQIFIRETVAGETPSKVFAGDSFTETFNLANVGDEEADMVQLSLDISYPFALTGSSSNFFIGDLRQGESKSLQIEISVDRDAVGVYSIPFKISYEDPQGETYIKFGTLGIEVLGKPQIFIRETVAGETPSKVFAGDSFTETFNLANVGDEEADMVQLSLDISYPFALTGSSSNFFIGDLRQGESKSLQIEISVDRKALVGVYSIPFVVSYEDHYGKSYTKSGLIGVKILGKPQIFIDEIIVDPSPVTPGESGLMTVKMTNVGTDAARDASIKIFGGKNLIASSFAHVANIDSMKSESIIFPVSVDGTLEPSTYLLNITVIYRDDLNNTYNVSKLYEFKVLPITPFVPYFYIGVAAGIAAVALVGYFVYTWKPEDLTHEPQAKNPGHTNADEAAPAEIHLKELNRSRAKSSDRGNHMGRRVLLVSCVVAIYIGLLIPYLFHHNLESAGVIIYSNEITLESLPGDVQKVCRLRGLFTPVVLLVKHLKPEWVTMVIAPERFASDTYVEMSDFVVNWRVDWRDFDLADRTFDRFAIAEVRQLGSFETGIETMLSTQPGSILYELSRIDFYGGPVLVVFCLAVLLQGRLAVWNLPTLIGCYSLQVFCINVLALERHLYVAEEWKFFGYLFIVSIPLAVYLWHLERGPAGRALASKMRALSQALGLARD